MSVPRELAAASLPDHAHPERIVFVATLPTVLGGQLAILDRLLKIRSNDVGLSPLQLTFIFGLWVSLLALMKGARLMLAPKFTSDAIGRCLVETTVLAGVPSMFRALLTGSAVKAPNLRLILTSGEVLAPGLAHAMTRLAPGGQ